MVESVGLAGTREICNFCKCSRVVLMRWIGERKFPAKKLGGSWRADREDVREWMRKQIKT